MGYMDLLQMLKDNEFNVPSMQSYHNLPAEPPSQDSVQLLGRDLGEHQDNAVQNLMGGASSGAQSMAQQSQADTQNAVAANNAFQAQRQNQMNATEQQAAQALAQQQQEQAQSAGMFSTLLGLALPFITGGAGAAASSGVTGASGATLSNALSGTLLDPMKKTFFPMR